MNFQNLIIYDNDKTIDRYTVLTERASPLERIFNEGKDLWESLSLSHNPDSPQGVSMWGLALPGDHLGTRINFSDLPANVQAHIKRRLA